MELIALFLFLLFIFKPRKKKKAIKRRKRNPSSRRTAKEEFFIVPICALDKHTCPICAKYDGIRVPVAKAKAGVNVPPFHDGCRCASSKESSKFPHQISKRFARNPITGKGYYVVTDTYHNWIQTLTEQELSALIEYQQLNRR